MKNSRLLSIVLLLFVMMVVAANVSGQTPDTTNPWAAWTFLIGEWVADTGQAGGGTGGFTLAPDLDGKVLARRSHAEYPASGGRPATSHEDLTIVYHNPDGSMAAQYFDNEGHQISYAVSVVADSAILRLVSDPNAPGPRFRLTYKKLADDSISIVFDIAPPGKPDAFSQYLAGTAHRVK